MRRLAAELLGTFMLVAAVLGAAVVSGNAAGLGVAFAVGLSVMAMIYAMGPISGGHFNPAVTLGLTAAGRFDAKDIIPYVLAQLAGGIFAALFFYIILSGKPDFLAAGFASTGYGEHSAGGFTLLGAFLSGIVFTAIFVLIIAGSPECKKEPGSWRLSPLAYR
jgi:aquaporin Z